MLKLKAYRGKIILLKISPYGTLGCIFFIVTNASNLDK